MCWRAAPEHAHNATAPARRGNGIPIEAADGAAEVSTPWRRTGRPPRLIQQSATADWNLERVTHDPPDPKQAAHARQPLPKMMSALLGQPRSVLERPVLCTKAPGGRD